MSSFLIQRLGRAVAVMTFLTIVAFLMVRAIPGDPVLTRLGLNSDPALANQIRASLGLDRPWYTQYFSWMGDLLRGDLGVSLGDGRSVAEEIALRLPVSAELAVFAVIIAVSFGLPLGVLASSFQDRWPDAVVRAVGFFVQAVPAFVAGTVVIMLIAKTQFNWPTIGYVSFAEDPVGNIKGMLLPALMLGLPIGAILARFLRSSMIESLGQSYIRTARSKGAGRKRILFGHALRNSLAPFLTVTSMELASLIGGTVVVEQVFAIPGLGQLLVASINANDYPLIQGCILAIGGVFVITNLIADGLLPLVDPRIRIPR